MHINTLRLSDSESCNIPVKYYNIITCQNVIYFLKYFDCFLLSFTMWKEKHQASKCIQKIFHRPMFDVLEQIMNFFRRHAPKHHSEGLAVSAARLLTCPSHLTWNGVWGVGSTLSQSGVSPRAKFHYIPGSSQSSAVKWHFRWHQLMTLPSDIFCCSGVFRVWSISALSQDLNKK